MRGGQRLVAPKPRKAPDLGVFQAHRRMQAGKLRDLGGLGGPGADRAEPRRDEHLVRRKRLKPGERFAGERRKQPLGLIVPVARGDEIDARGLKPAAQAFAMQPLFQLPQSEG